MTSAIDITLHAGPLPPAQRLVADGVGAVVCFEGVVRPSEAGQPLVALLYEAYEPMTSRQLHALAVEMMDTHRLTALRVEHSVGRVAAGEVSFRLTVSSTHRAEAMRATGNFIDRMKRDVALWKRPEFNTQGASA